MRATLVYSVLRIALIVVCSYVFFLLGMGIGWAVIAGTVVALMLSVVLLRTPRARMADQMAAHDAKRSERRRERREAQLAHGEFTDEDIEDEYLDEPGDPHEPDTPGTSLDRSTGSTPQAGAGSTEGEPEQQK